MAKAFAKSFYNSKDWKKVRESVLIRDKGLCQGKDCLKPAEEVHHVEELSPRNINNPNITLNPDNLISLCKDCHFKVHRAEALKRYKDRQRQRILKGGMYFDEDGMIKPMEVNIVYGAPASGKSTYVETHRRCGDLVIDLDRIQWALGKTDGKNNLLDLSILVREYLYDLISDRAKEVDSKNVWVVAGLPNKKERTELAERLDAGLILIDTDIETCIERARERNDSQLQIAIVENYFEKFER